MTKTEKTSLVFFTLSLITQSLAMRSAPVTTATTVITKIVGISRNRGRWLGGDVLYGEEKGMSDWFGILLTILSIFIGGFALGYKCGKEIGND